MSKDKFAPVEPGRQVPVDGRREGTMWVVMAIGVLVVLDLLAVYSGADSRDGNDWMTHRTS